MSKFNSVLSTYFEDTDLQKIRIKFDPAAEGKFSEDYVGFVLQEQDNGNVIAIVPGYSSKPVRVKSNRYTFWDDE